MRRYIEELKKRPDHHRQRVALGVSGGITAIIFVLWVSVTVPNTAQTFAREEKQEKKDTPISVLSQGAAQVYQAVKQNISDVSQNTVDLQSEYEKMKQEVESGQIKLIPTSQEIIR